MNIITTLVNMRAPGLGFHRLPLFAWAMLLQSIIIILCIPVLAGALTMILTDRNFNTAFYDPAGGGDPVLYQHLFWFFGLSWPNIIGLLGFGWVVLAHPLCSEPRHTAVMAGSIPTTETNERVANSFIQWLLTLVGVPTWFPQWLAGLIDSDGSFQVSKHGYTSMEITAGLADTPMLSFAAGLFGGKISPRTGVKAWRLRIHNLAGMMLLVTLVNGWIRHTSKLVAFTRVCVQLGIAVIKPMLVATVPYLAGFFDGDGTIGFSFKGGHPQLTLSVANKLRIDLVCFLTVFGGAVYHDISWNGYIWSVQSRADVTRVSAALAPYAQSAKSRRFAMVPRYYELVGLRAYQVSSPHHHAWIHFANEWEEVAKT
jgi:hypothetical protein